MELESSVEIGRPADEVFRYIADFENNPVWQEGMRSCRWTSDGPLAVGSTYEQLASFMGRPIRTTFEVTALEADRSISIASIISTFPIQVTRTVEALSDERCRVTAHVAGQPPWYMRLPGMSLMVKRSVDGDYARLKAQLEGGPPSG